MRKILSLPSNFLSKEVEKKDIRCIMIGVPINHHELRFLLADHKEMGPFIHSDHFIGIGKCAMVGNLDLVEILNESNIPARGISVASIEELAFDILETLHDDVLKMDHLLLRAREDFAEKTFIIPSKNKMSYGKNRNISKREINSRNRQIKGLFRNR